MKREVVLSTVTEGGARPRTRHVNEDVREREGAGVAGAGQRASPGAHGLGEIRLRRAAHSARAHVCGARRDGRVPASVRKDGGGVASGGNGGQSFFEWLAGVRRVDFKNAPTSRREGRCP